MRKSAVLVALSVLSATAAAEATPIPQVTRDADGFHFHPPPSLSIPTLHSLSPTQSTDVLDRELVVDLDPPTGAVDATFSLRLLALEDGVSSVTLYIDAGLDGTALDSTPPGATFTSQQIQSLRLIDIEFAPLAEGEEIQLALSYAGTLACAESVSGQFCDQQPTMSVAFPGSLLPIVIDQSGLGGYNAWGAPRALEMRMPSGTDMVATGELVLDDDDGTTRTLRFETPGYHSAGAYLVLWGDFDALPVADVSPPSQVYSQAGADQWTADMAAWMEDIYAFVDAQAGQPMPWPETQVVKLPANWIFPGTAGHGIVLLAETYGLSGADYFEETLAHETAHEWWGILVSPTDYVTTRWLVEGLAVISQIDYAQTVLNPTSDRETYLERRFREHDIALRYMPQGIVPAVAPAAPTNPGADDTLWAYIRSSAALDTLRLLVGEEAFGNTLQAWADACAYQHCDTADFKAVIETTAGVDLSDAFDAYVFSQTYPAPAFAFSQSEGTLTITTDATQPLPVDLVVTYDDHSATHHRVTLTESTTLAVDGPVRSVRPHPRHDGVLRSHSAVAGDVTFDGEVDGLDIIACARAVGASLQPGAGSEGLFRIDLDFDPRCDVDDSATIDQLDLGALGDRFGAQQ